MNASMSGMAWLFQSTLSVRRATQHGHASRGQHLISIHALRKESDGADGTIHQYVSISIHALRKESDCLILMFSFSPHHFNPRSP